MKNNNAMETIKDLKAALEDLLEREFSEEEVINIGLHLTDLAELLIDRKSQKEDLPIIDYGNNDQEATVGTPGD